MRRLKHPIPEPPDPEPELPIWQCCRCRRQTRAEQEPVQCDCGSLWHWVVNRDRVAPMLHAGSPHHDLADSLARPPLRKP